MLAWNKEGLEVAKWLNTQGVTAGVLKYRVPRRDPDEPHLEALQDAQRAVRLMRAQAAEWGIDKGRVGVLGFSAGGHLTIMTGLQGDNASYASRDAIDEQSCKPNFLCPIYAAYLGEKYNDRTEVALGSQVKVTPETPPMFLAVTADDSFRGVQAASLFIALKQAGVPAELHIFARGGHGYGIRASERPVSTWHLRLANRGWSTYRWLTRQETRKEQFPGDNEIISELRFDAEVEAGRNRGLRQWRCAVSLETHSEPS